VGTLSGGERRRLQLLLVIAGRPNVLFLDEPTNDLDLETIRLIEDFLSQWPGTLVVVSHDRTFLSRTTDRLLEVHADGTISDIPGGIDAWIARAAGVVSSPTALVGPADPTAAARAPSGEVPLGRQIREAEKNMSRLDRRRSALTKKLLASPDHSEMARLGDELETVQQELSAAEDYWLTLIG
jgi:ATP-binding cassette subfamily F protein uup